MTPNVTVFQGLKQCIQYLTSNLRKQIFNPSKYYNVSNVIRLALSGNQVEDYMSHNCLECHQYEDHYIILNRIWSV